MRTHQTATRTLEREQGRIILPHDFCRTVVRSLERASVPRSVAMKLIGHETENALRRYATCPSLTWRRVSHRRLAGQSGAR